MRFSIRLPWNGDAGRETILQVAKQADAAGFHSAWVGDHVVFPVAETASRIDPAKGGAYPPALMAGSTLEALSVLAFASAATTRLRLGTGCLILAQRQPLVVAKQVATLDQLSGGRIILGAAAGWLAEEYAALGVPFEERGPRLDEAVALMRHCWETEQPSWAGEYWAFPPLHFQPKPVQRPFPVWFGGHTTRARRRAASLGDGWHGSRLSPAKAATLASEIRRFRADGPRRDLPFTVHVSPHVPLSELNFQDLVPAYEQAGVDLIMVDPGGPQDILRMIERLERFIA